MIELVLFVTLSVMLIRFTLRRPHRHRFPRLLAFESLLGLVSLNARCWFVDPFSPAQWASWVCLIGSLALALHGFWLLRSAGEPQGDIEHTTQLVTRGAYRWIRHPLYASLILFGAGVLLKGSSAIGFILLLTLLGALIATVVVEEAENMQRFGPDYQDYMEKTKRFIPFLY